MRRRLSRQVAQQSTETMRQSVLQNGGQFNQALRCQGDSVYHRSAAVHAPWNLVTGVLEPRSSIRMVCAEYPCACQLGGRYQSINTAASTIPSPDIEASHTSERM